MYQKDALDTTYGSRRKSGAGGKGGGWSGIAAESEAKNAFRMGDALKQT